MSSYVELIEGPCPTCDGDGSVNLPFDGNCPAAWAHRFIVPAGGVHGGHAAFHPAFLRRPQERDNG